MVDEMTIVYIAASDNIELDIVKVNYIVLSSF